MSDLPGKSVYWEGVAERSDNGKITLQESLLDTYKSFKVQALWWTHEANEGVIHFQNIN